MLDVILQARNYFFAGFDSISESEIIPFSGVSKSGAGSIIHAGGSGGFGHWLAGGVETQPLITSSDITLKFINSSLGTCQFSCVFRIKRSDTALAYLHVFYIRR